MRVTLHSASPRLGNVAGNLQTVAEALATDSDLVVFPELFLSGYNIGDDVQQVALAADDPRLGVLQEAADRHDTHAIVGAPLRLRAGEVNNAALCIAPGRSPHWVPKRVLPTFTTFQEGLFFTPGTTQPVWHTRLGAIGVSICYDLYFPELQRRQALDGADILVNISASPSTSRRFFEAILPARAIENTVFCLYCNNVGAQDGIVFWGGSQAWGPRGGLLAAAAPYQAEAITLDLDLATLEAARQGRPTLRDSGGRLLEDLA